MKKCNYIIIIMLLFLCGCYALNHIKKDLTYNYNARINNIEQTIVKALNEKNYALLFDEISDNYKSDINIQNVSDSLKNIEGEYMSYDSVNSENETNNNNKKVCIGAGQIDYKTNTNMYKISYIICLRDDIDPKNGAKRFCIR